MRDESREAVKKTCLQAGSKNDRSRSNWLLWLMPITGFFALLWFLIRVIPKPSRAAYPCQRVAFPLASSFVIWMTGLVGSAVALKKARVLVKDRRFLGALFFVTVAIMAISLPLTYYAPLSIAADDGSWYNPFDSAENLPLDPKGVPVGIHPGRVVWNYNPDATNWNGSSGYWKDYIDQAVVDQMLSNVLIDLVRTSPVDAPSESEAWDRLFRHYNLKVGNGDIGYQTDQKIAIKLNFNKATSYTGDNNCGLVSPQVVLALLRQLVNNANADDDDITFYDTTRLIPDHTFTRCKTEFPEVHFVDSVGGSTASGDRELAVEDTSEQIVWSDPLDSPLEVGKEIGAPTYLPTCVTEADYFINLASLKGHTLGGITGCAKNHFGSFMVDGTVGGQQPKKAGVHPYIAVHDYHVNSSWWFDQRPMGTYTPLVDLMGHEHLGGKTILYLQDGLYAAKDQGTSMSGSDKWESKPFSNDWCSSLFASQDPVAIDSVALDFLRCEPYVQGSTSLNAGDTVDNYLHEAAEADSPPSGHGYDYDPVGTGTPLESLGVHEHWNDALKKQYSGNLKTADGIELIRSPRAWGDINGGGVDLEDLLIIANNWLKDDCGPSNDWCNGADITHDTKVNMLDYSYVAADWQVYVINE